MSENVDPWPVHFSFFVQIWKLKTEIWKLKSENWKLKSEKDRPGQPKVNYISPNQHETKWWVVNSPCVDYKTNLTRGFCHSLGWTPGSDFDENWNLTDFDQISIVKTAGSDKRASQATAKTCFKLKWWTSSIPKFASVGNSADVLGSIAPLEDCYQPKLFPEKKIAIK